MIFALKNRHQDYAWGSHSFIQELTGQSELFGCPVAELWLGAHPKAPSQIEIDPDSLPLDQYLAENPKALQTTRERFDTLPFLMKVLAAKAPLSIQAHPDASQAFEGFRRENELGIPIDDARRSYKDPRHKPEMVCALTDFVALCGFRPIEELVQSLQRSGLDRILAPAHTFVQNPSPATWKQCFAALLRLRPSDVIWAREKALEQDCSLHQAWQGKACTWVKKLFTAYPEDAGALAPLFLQLHHLKPSQALALPAGIPHAYLEGAAIEVMANSDNVLRGGLTQKYIDIDEYISILDFEPWSAKILTPSVPRDGVLYYPSTALEFQLGYLRLGQNQMLQTQLKVPAIILCTQGELHLSQGSAELRLHKGESAFCDAQESGLQLSGVGESYICGTNL